MTRPRDYVPFVVINFQPSLFDRASFTLMLKYSDRLVINPSSAVKRRQTTNDRQVTDLEALRAPPEGCTQHLAQPVIPRTWREKTWRERVRCCARLVEAKPPLPARRTQR